MMSFDNESSKASQKVSKLTVKSFHEDLDLRALIVSECPIPNASKLIGSFIKMSKMIFIKLLFQLVV